MTATLYMFHQERAVRRPYAELGLASLKQLRALNVAQGRGEVVRAICAELARRERMDAKYGAP